MSRSIWWRPRRVPSDSSGSISDRMPPTSSGVASRRLSRFSYEIIVPTPSCRNSSSSMLPSSDCGIRCARSPRHARIECFRKNASSPGRCRNRAARPPRRATFHAPARLRRRRCRALGQEDDLVGAQRDRGGRRDIFHRQVERFAGRREAERRQQHELAARERMTDRFGVDLAHDARMREIDPVENPHRPCGHEVARHDADVRVRHRRVRQNPG